MKRFAIFFAALFGAVGAFAQNDTAYVPFVVNVAATVTAVPANGTTAVVTQVQMSVEANTQTTLKIPLPKTLGVLNGAQRQANIPAVISGGGGKVTLNLPAQSYKNAEIALYSVNGKRILRDAASASSAAKSISRRNAAPGAYLLSVKGADGAAFTSRLTHIGGNLVLTVAFGGENPSATRQLAKGTAAGDWTVTVSAAGRVDSLYTLTPVKGTMPAQNITLRETAPVNPELGAPANVTATTVLGTRSITVNWSAVSGATEYNVYRGTDAAGPYSLVTFLADTTLSNRELTAGTTYYYKVSARKGSVESPQSAYASATIEALSGTSGTFIDSRDEKTYRYITVLGRKWMAENLNFEVLPNLSLCYIYSADSCTKYGKLYNWSTAITSCPVGWHLPTRQEWVDLSIATGGAGTYGTSGTAGNALKSTTGWGSFNGTDSYGFKALPGGLRTASGNFLNTGVSGSWWTATADDNDHAYYRNIDIGSTLNEATSDNYTGFSVRCVED